MADVHYLPDAGTPVCMHCKHMGEHMHLPDLSLFLDMVHIFTAPHLENVCSTHAHTHNTQNKKHEYATINKTKCIIIMVPFCANFILF